MDGGRSSESSRLDALSISSVQSTSSTVAGGYGGGCGLRICGPRDLVDNFRFGKREDEVESLLSKIEKIYNLTGVDMGKVGKGCSLCLGLLDPTTNLQFNRLFAAGFLVLPPADSGRQGAAEDTLAHRSLDGLIAFLTCLFPYLPDAEALAYVNAADADPLVAALLVIKKRKLTIDSFITAASVEIALRSAAAAAKHPDPELFIQVWNQASLSPEEMATALKGSNKGLIPVEYMESFLYQFRGSSEDDLQLEDSWHLAIQRLRPLHEKFLLKTPGCPSARGALKRMLLSMIHGYYLKALAALPKQDLTERYHRSLLIGGHCYGPLDPVSNIIINTIWYDHSFPPAIEVQLKAMISTDSLWRIAARSLYGLVSFLCSRNKHYTPDDALRRLLHARANLSVADPARLSDLDFKKTVRGGAAVIGAYFAAARSAKHPRPSSQAEFLGVPESVNGIRCLSDELLLSVRDGCALSRERLGCITMLFRCSSSISVPPPQRETQNPIMQRHEIYVKTCTAQNMFWSLDDRVGRKVEAALHNFNKTAVSKYSLHVICGVNELVREEFSLDPEVRAYNPWTPYKYHYSHINFLATCEGSEAPTLFFAECSNHGTDTPWCVPVLLHPVADISLQSMPDLGVRPEAARCIYCECENNRIWHPVMERFCGRDDFQKFGRGSYSNDNLLVGKSCEVDWIESVADDVIYSKFCDSGDRGSISSDGPWLKWGL